MKKIMLWYLLLTKRLLKKPVFIVVLAMVPILVMSLNIVAQEDSGVISIALAQENKNDAMSSEIVDKLLSKNSLINYIECNSEDEAETFVREGKADSAWIFTDEMQGKTDHFVTNISEKNYIVRVVEREQTVPLLLSHEKLCGTLYKSCSESLYIQFVRENVNELDQMTDQQLMQYYDGIHADGNLFEYLYVDSDNSAEAVVGTSYLVTPVRGFMSVLIILCGLATAMFFMQDEKKGTFAWVSMRVRPFMSFGYHFTSIILISAVVLVSLFLTGISVSAVREVLMIMLYALCCTVFCMIVRLLCSDIKRLAVLTPFIVIALIAICPVFFDLEFLRPIQMFLPPYYYLNSVYDNRFLLYMVLYFITATALYALLCKLLKKV